LLAWAQFERSDSSEPLVVGLVPTELRSRYAVWSLTNSNDGQPTPVPSESDWAQLGQREAYTTVRIVRVITPVNWAAALADGDLTDPGIAARDVEADVTTHWLEGKQPKSATASVTIGLNLEGPPSREGYGFVNAPTFESVPVN